MRPLILSLLLILAAVAPATAFDDPKALITAIYQPYASGGKQDNPEQYYSAHLKQLYAENLQRQVVDKNGQPLDPSAPDVLKFDPFIEGEHSLINDLAIADPVVLGDRATATVSFHNFDHATILTVAMVKEQDGWKVDDIASLGGTQNWLLSWLLQYDPFSVN
jgi:hypothetical protein